MRNVLLFGASALALSLTAAGALAQQSPSDLSTYTHNADRYAPQGYAAEYVYRPRAVLGAHERLDQFYNGIPDHEDARSIAR